VELAQPVAARWMLARQAALGVASWAKLAARLAVRLTARTLTAMRRAARQMEWWWLTYIGREADGSEDCGEHCGEDTELGHVRRELFAELGEVGANAAAAAFTAVASAASAASAAATAPTEPPPLPKHARKSI